MVGLDSRQRDQHRPCVGEHVRGSISSRSPFSVDDDVAVVDFDAEQLQHRLRPRRMSLAVPLYGVRRQGLDEADGAAPLVVPGRPAIELYAGFFTSAPRQPTFVK